MNEIYLAEQCPRAKQDLQKMVNRMRFRGLMNDMFSLNLSQSIMPLTKFLPPSLEESLVKENIANVTKSMFWTLEAERCGVI